MAQQRSLFLFFFLILSSFFFFDGALTEEATPSDVIVLTEDNFEGLTQASTGATTGDWFIEFYAPWCGHCKKLVPTWENLATQLKGSVVVAKVDADQNRKLGHRFGIRGFPTLKFFKGGNFYNYSGDRSIDSLVAFAEGGYKSVATNPVPKIPTPMDELQMVAIRALSTLEEDLVHIYELRKLAAILVLVLGFFLGVLITTICCAIFPPSPPSPARPQQKVATTSSSSSSSPASKKVGSKKEN